MAGNVINHFHEETELDAALHDILVDMPGIHFRNNMESMLSQLWAKEQWSLSGMIKKRSVRQGEIVEKLDMCVKKLHGEAGKLITPALVVIKIDNFKAKASNFCRSWQKDDNYWACNNRFHTLSLYLWRASSTRVWMVTRFHVTFCENAIFFP